MGPGPNIRQIREGLRYSIWLRALLYLGCMHYYVACATLELALVYCNFHKEVRLSGWGTEGPGPDIRPVH